MCNKSTPRSDCLSSPASQNTAASRTHPPSTMLYTLLAMQCITASAFVAVPMAAQHRRAQIVLQHGGKGFGYGSHVSPLATETFQPHPPPNLQQQGQQFHPGHQRTRQELEQGLPRRKQWCNLQVSFFYSTNATP